MSRKHHNPNRAGFLNRVEDIRHAEKDVDRLLDAARLQRIESGKRPISPALRIAAMLAIVAVMCVVFVLVSKDDFAPMIYLFVGGGGIGAICACLFAGQGIEW